MLIVSLPNTRKLLEMWQEQDRAAFLKLVERHAEAARQGPDALVRWNRSKANLLDCMERRARVIALDDDDLAKEMLDEEGFRIVPWIDSEATRRTA
jgi:hypothetical protein